MTIMFRPESVYATINGKRINIGSAADAEFSVSSVPPRRDSVEILEFRLRNRGNAPLEISSIELVLNQALFLGKADSGRFYKEGLTVVGVASSRGKDECDFELDPGFLRFTVSEPSKYSWSRKGVFSAEQIGVARDTRSGKCLIAGFVTCANFLCRVIMDMGTAELTAVVDLENVVLNPGSEIMLEELMVATGDDPEALLGLYARETGARMNARIRQAIPTGWCSYYCYYGQETEDDILENARFLSQHRDSMPIEYIQIDDGWQKSRGDWTGKPSGKISAWHGVAGG